MERQPLKMYLLGTIRNVNKPKDIAGYRMYLSKDGGNLVKDVPAEKLVSLNQNYSTVNFKVAGGKIVESNGSINRYAVIDSATGQVLKKSLVVISRLKDGFRMVDANGNVAALTDKEALAYCKMVGISNGKVTKISGTETISSISGAYPEEDLTVAGLKGISHIVIKPTAEKGKLTKESVPEAKLSLRKVFTDAFGEHRANVVMHLIEKGIDPQVIAETMQASGVGIALAGLLVYEGEKCTDAKLRELLCKKYESGKVVNEKAIRIVEYMLKEGVRFDSYWDARQRAGCSISEARCDISYYRLTNCVLNYVAQHGSGEFKGFAVDVVSEDELEIKYNGKSVAVKYPVVGFDPIEKTLVMDNDGEAIFSNI